MNLYSYAGNNPIAFSDPFGLCAAGDSILVTVEIDCGRGRPEKRAVWAQQVSDSAMTAIVAAAGRLTGGNRLYTPDKVQAAFQVLASAKSVYAFPRSIDGHEVTAGGTTRTGGGLPPYTAFREDALTAIVSGDLGAQIGNIGFNAATILGHEGAHLLGSHHPDTYLIRWGFKP